jgi:hypothetical protein
VGGAGVKEAICTDCGATFEYHVQDGIALDGGACWRYERKRKGYVLAGFRWTNEAQCAACGEAEGLDDEGELDNRN